MILLIQVQVAIGTNDVYKSAEVVDLATKELGGKILTAKYWRLSYGHLIKNDC